MSIVDFIQQEAKTAKWVGVRIIMSGWTLISVGGLAKDAATQ